MDNKERKSLLFRAVGSIALLITVFALTVMLSSSKNVEEHVDITPSLISENAKFSVYRVYDSGNYIYICVSKTTASVSITK